MTIIKLTYIILLGMLNMKQCNTAFSPSRKEIKEKNGSVSARINRTSEIE
jgi:hypothetical protein